MVKILDKQISSRNMLISGLGLILNTWSLKLEFINLIYLQIRLPMIYFRPSLISYTSHAQVKFRNFYLIVFFFPFKEVGFKTILQHLQPLIYIHTKSHILTSTSKVLPYPNYNFKSQIETCEVLSIFKF